ncbi:EAL domain-containing protein [Crenobacter luteus]|uniref:EAL domain-containing protein n=1 Tax=Crenobacter luteus TaxID=1452487 RepID=A0A163DSN9_9NEIS|nr:EAL domain-containing protein [Crenobacter luteus]KZE35251.1 hypothetical protein AVW16_04340 [Crenobacter luteus]
MNAAVTPAPPACLSSAFQPIVSPAHRRLVGFEALLRGRDQHGAPLSPAALFAAAPTPQARRALDLAACRQHLSAFARASPAGCWLFLNLSTDLLLSPDCGVCGVAALLDACGVPPERLVIEILEGRIADFAALSRAVAGFQALGCRVAIDDFGADASNVERLWRLEPDIVKLDRRIVRAAGVDAAARRVLPALVSLVHEAGSLALIEGVETLAEARVALDTAADLVQGFYFAHPGPRAETARPDVLARLSRAWDSAPRDEAAQRARLAPLLPAFHAAVRRLAGGAPLPAACAALLADPAVDRCYLIDAAGVQQGASVVRHDPPGPRARFNPLEEAAGADWSRKPYYRRALAAPGQWQMSRPYPSVGTGRLCVTLSLAFETDERQYVFCCDLDWEQG